jgi:hypothetical protein
MRMQNLASPISLQITPCTYLLGYAKFLSEFWVMYIWHSVEHFSRQIQQLYHYKLLRALSIQCSYSDFLS